MKSFLEIWGEAFPDAARQKLDVEVSWEAADELPGTSGAVAVELIWAGEWEGRCVVVGAWEEIAPLMGEGGGEEKKGRKAARGGPDAEAAAGWRNWLAEVTESMRIPAAPRAVEIVERPRGVPLAPYVLRAGERPVHLALVCEVKVDGAQAEAPEGGGIGTEDARAAGGTGNANLDLLLDIEVDASLRFGSREIAIRELLATGPGDVLELDRTISDPVDLVVGDKIVARGEVVLVNGNFGLRVTEVAEPRKCLESVRCLF